MKRLRRQFSFSQATKYMIAVAVGVVLTVGLLGEQMWNYWGEQAQADIDEHTLDIAVAATSAQAEAGRVARAHLAAKQQGAKPGLHADADMATGEAWKSDGPIGRRPLSGEGEAAGVDGLRLEG